MRNARAKGNRIERMGRAWLEGQGWRVGKVTQTGRRGDTDLFGLFDAVAVRGRRVLFVQFTSNRPHTHGKFAAWSADHSQALQMIWHDRRGWVLFWYSGGDKRKQDLRR